MGKSKPLKLQLGIVCEREVLCVREEYSRKSRFDFNMIIYILIQNVNFEKMGRKTNH